MERDQHTDDVKAAAGSSEYEPPLVEDLDTESEGATVTVTGGIIGSGGVALAEPTDDPPPGDG